MVSGYLKMWTNRGGGEEKFRDEDFLTLWKDSDPDNLHPEGGEARICEVAVALLQEVVAQIVAQFRAEPARIMPNCPD